MCVTGTFHALPPPQGVGKYCIPLPCSPSPVLKPRRQPRPTDTPCHQTPYEVTTITQHHTLLEPVYLRAAQDSLHKNTVVPVCALCTLAGLAQHLVSITIQVGKDEPCVHFALFVNWKTGWILSSCFSLITPDIWQTWKRKIGKTWTCSWGGGELSTLLGFTDFKFICPAITETYTQRQTSFWVNAHKWTCSMFQLNIQMFYVP